jgi:hypothetical protein
MRSKRVLWVAGILLLGVGIVAVTLLLTPQETNPAFAAAVNFMNAAGKGDDATASTLLSDELLAYVAANCPDGSVSACVQGYIPPEWGDLISAVFRRAAPDGDAWDVDLIATYEQDTGASGVCAYTRVQQDESGAWRVYEWAGFLWCGDGRSRNMATNPETPNRAP